MLVGQQRVEVCIELGLSSRMGRGRLFRFAGDFISDVRVRRSGRRLRNGGLLENGLRI